MGKCDDWPVHGLTSEDFRGSLDNGNNNSPEPKFTYWTWKKDITGHVSKTKETISVSNTLDLWTQTIDDLKQHIHRKRVQFSAIEGIKKNLTEGQLLTHLDYSKNYKAKHQNEIQSAYFGGESFTLFTAVTYYREGVKIAKISTRVTTEASDKSRSALMACISKLIEHQL